jgi:hypothetical protein
MMQVGLRSENMMITHSESNAYRPPLSHAAADQWATSSSSSSSRTGTSGSTVPTPREPAASARGAPASVFRHHSTGPANNTHSQVSSHPIPVEQPLVGSASAPASGSLGTVSTSSTSSSLTTSSSQTHSPSTRTRRASEDTLPIKLRNLSHVVDIARDDSHQPQPSRRNRSGYEDRRRYEISGMPVGDVIEMVASLLTKITTTNDRQHEHLHRNMPPHGQADATGMMSSTTNSVLAFHGKNVPSISIMSYLSRIHKYCPTTYEVFLSLLVYFDRMTERVNKQNSWSTSSDSSSIATNSTTSGETTAQPPQPHHVFVVDSYNIHRLVIAGVTCASKFFSDVFYTNSRYAKVLFTFHPLRLQSN